MSDNKSKRLRVFAGPNGSGKTTLAIDLMEKGRFKTKIFVNADEIEKSVRQKGFLSLSAFGIKNIDTKTFRHALRKRGILQSIPELTNNINKFSVKQNRLHFKGEINSYVASDIASFLRYQLLSSGKSYCFETVFSHESKLQFIQEARNLGYRIYLYFVSTDDVLININRVKIRELKNGHPVPEDKIRSRYERSLNLMFDAVRMSHRAFLFDHSGKYFELVAQVSDGKHVEILDIDNVIPHWFVEKFYLKYAIASGILNLDDLK